MGERVPREWCEGAEYERGVCLAGFEVGEVVVVVRSDGTCTFGQVICLGPNSGDKGALSVLVGAGLQKTVAAEKVGKISDGVER